MPIVVHRVVYGSLERFLGVFIEHSQGKFPTWLAPVQVRVMSISEPANDYAEKVYGELRKHGIRAYADLSDRTLEYKIREAQMQKVPYMVILGKKEQESGKITVRDRAGKQAHDLELIELVKKILKEISERSFSNEL